MAGYTTHVDRSPSLGAIDCANLEPKKRRVQIGGAPCRVPAARPSRVSRSGDSRSAWRERVEQMDHSVGGCELAEADAIARGVRVRGGGAEVQDLGACTLQWALVLYSCYHSWKTHLRRPAPQLGL